MSDVEQSTPEVLENEKMWAQRAIDTPDEVLNEMRRLKDSQLTLDTSRE
jgi:hypothetical protein